MRHGKKFNHLGRKTAHRKAMLSNMACSLIEHKRIKTTVAKAKALRQYVEPLITKSKTDETHSRRTVFSYLQNKYAVSELFRTVAPKIRERDGGYTRIIKIGNRLGDNAEMCYIELVDFNELMLNAKSPKKAKRSRRGGAKKAAPVAETTEAVVEDAVVVEEAPAKEEAPKEEKPKAEDKEEKAPKAEKKEAAPKAEKKAEEKAPKAEKKEAEPKKEEKKEDKKEDKGEE